MINAKVYLVGGAVRDHLLGIQSRDRDYVVVGATPDDMIQAGFSQVGASFPVFLHPTTGEEYALARTERKNGKGYHGFEVFYDQSVTLVDDLKRRDLTINSMAMDLQTGEIIDPFGGKLDLAKSVLRHTSEAFADDPLRVLRVARFAARYKFMVHPTTVDLGSSLVDELVYLPAERVWTELYKGFSEKYSEEMIRVLAGFGALRAKPLSDYFDGDHHQYAVSFLQFANTNDADVKVLLAMSLNKDDKTLEKMRVPNHLAQASKLFHTVLTTFTKKELTAEDVHGFLTSVRNDLSTPTMTLAMKAARIMAEMKLQSRVFDYHFEVVKKAAASIKQLDMASIVAAADKKTVKYVVDNVKFQAVRASMA